MGEPWFKFTAAGHEPIEGVVADVDVVRHSLNVRVLSRLGIGNETARYDLKN